MYLFSRTKTEVVRDNEYGDVVRKIRERQESLMRTLENVVNVPMSAKAIEMDNVKITNYVEKPIIEEKQLNETVPNRFDLEQEFNYDRDAYKNLFNNLNIDAVEKSSNEISYYDHQPSTAQFPTASEFDVDSTYSEISEAKTKMSNMQEKAAIARRNVEESDRILEELIVQNEETQRRLKNAELRNQQLEQELINVLKVQKTNMNQEIKKTENSISNSNMRLEENNSKILEFKNMIKATQEKTEEINNKITRSEELLKSLQNIVNYEYERNYEPEEEDSYRKVA